MMYYIKGYYWLGPCVLCIVYTNVTIHSFHLTCDLYGVYRSIYAYGPITPIGIVGECLQSEAPSDVYGMVRLSNPVAN
jgi:hypothetical protein